MLSVVAEAFVLVTELLKEPERPHYYQGVLSIDILHHLADKLLVHRKAVPECSEQEQSNFLLLMGLYNIQARIQITE